MRLLLNGSLGRRFSGRLNRRGGSLNGSLGRLGKVCLNGALALQRGDLRLTGADGGDDVGDRLGSLALELGNIPLADGAVVLLNGALLAGDGDVGLDGVGGVLRLLAGNGGDLLALFGRGKRDVLYLPCRSSKNAKDFLLLFYYAGFPVALYYTRTPLRLQAEKCTRM